MANALGTWIKNKFIGRNRNLISLDEPYEVMRRLLDGQSVTGILDAGASFGHISERMLRKFPNAHVYAFEPQPLYKDILERYAQKDKRFHPQFAALSDHEGTAQLNVMEGAGNTSLLNPTETLGRIDPVGSKIKEKVAVPLVTIDQWAGRNGNPEIQVMKFDIQGYELAALKGATQMLKSSTRIIYTEVWFNPVYEGGALLADIDLFLRGFGFLLYDLYKPKYNPGGLVQWGNAMFIHADRMRLK